MSKSLIRVETDEDQHARPSGATAFISVVIPTHNRADRLRNCLASFADQETAGGFEIVVVDDGGSERLEATTPPQVGAAPVRLIRQAQRGPAAARNRGLAEAKGELVAFIDDDCQPGRGWLQAIAEAHTRAPDAAIGGLVVNALGDNVYSAASQLLVDFLHQQWNEVSARRSFFTSNNLIFPVERLRAAGGFDERFPLPAAEDRELCMRWLDCGNRFVYEPRAIVQHYHDLNLTRFLRQHYRYGQGHYHLRRRRREINEQVRVERPRFYYEMFQFPFQRSPSRPLTHCALFGASQAANVAGFFVEALGFSEKRALSDNNRIAASDD